MNSSSISNENRIASESRICLCCGATDPFDLALCSRCLKGHAQTLKATAILLEHPDSDDQFQANRNTLARILHRSIEEVGICESAKGRRPLLIIPDELSPKVIAQLSKAGLSAYSLSTRYLWRFLPVSLISSIAVTLLANLYLAHTLSVYFFYFAIAASAVLLSLAHRLLSSPLIAPEHTEVIPEPLRTRVRTVATSLPDGPARLLFVDIVRAAKTVLNKLQQKQNISRLALQSDLHQLIHLACEGTEDLASLEDALSKLRSPHATTGATDPSRAAQKRGEAAAQTLSQRLLSVLSVLTDLTAEAALDNAERIYGLKGLCESLQCEVDVQRSVRKEMEQLL